MTFIYWFVLASSLLLSASSADFLCDLCVQRLFTAEWAEKRRYGDAWARAAWSAAARLDWRRSWLAA